jgi:hypothetical protein
MEMLSGHAVEGWLEGYVVSDRHGMLNSYEPFIHIIDSMVNQHCKWIKKCLEVEWRSKGPVDQVWVHRRELAPSAHSPPQTQTQTQTQNPFPPGPPYFL